MASTSGRKWRKMEMIGDTADGPSGQMVVIVGGQVIIDGFNISREAEIHSAAIQELSESFGAEMQPVVMEFQGKKYELTGSAEEQFKRWMSEFNAQGHHFH